MNRYHDASQPRVTQLPRRKAPTRAGAHWLVGLVILAFCAESHASSIFGRWHLAPAQATTGEPGDQRNDKSKGRKKSRKERKQEKERARQRDVIMPAVLKTKSLHVLRKDATTIELIPQGGDKLVLRPDGKAATLTLSNWGKADQISVRFSNWEGDTLIVESTPRQGLHFVHSYSVNGEGLLVQAIELFDGLESTTERRLFNPQPEPNQPPPH